MSRQFGGGVGTNSACRERGKKETGRQKMGENASSLLTTETGPETWREKADPNLRHYTHQGKGGTGAVIVKEPFKGEWDFVEGLKKRDADSPGKRRRLTARGFYWGKEEKEANLPTRP